MILVRSLVVRIAGRNHHALHPGLHQFIEVCTHAVGVRAVEQGRIRRHTEARIDCGAHPTHSNVVPAFTADGKIVVLALAIDVYGKRKILARLEQVQFFFEQKRVGAHVDVLLASHQTRYDLRHLRMQQRLATRDRYHRRATLIHRPEALFRRQLRF